MFSKTNMIKHKFYTFLPLIIPPCLHILNKKIRYFHIHLTTQRLINPINFLPFRFHPSIAFYSPTSRLSTQIYFSRNRKQVTRVDFPLNLRQFKYFWRKCHARQILSAGVKIFFLPLLAIFHFYSRIKSEIFFEIKKCGKKWKWNCRKLFAFSCGVEGKFL